MTGTKTNFVKKKHSNNLGKIYDRRFQSKCEEIYSNFTKNDRFNGSFNKYLKKLNRQNKQLKF